MATAATNQWQAAGDCFDNGDTSRQWDSNSNAETIQIDRTINQHFNNMNIKFYFVKGFTIIIYNYLFDYILLAMAGPN